MDALQQHHHHYTEPRIHSLSEIRATQMPESRGVEERRQEVFRIANELFRQQTTDWVTFFSRILGVDGVVRKMFPVVQEMSELEASREYAEIQQMMAKLRESGPPPVEEVEPTRVITVRLPKSVHEFLRTEAHEKRTSMNKLCISKLLQIVDEELIPTD